MKKLTLNLDDLSVTTFQPTNDASTAPGTVRGQVKESLVPEYCEGDPIYNTEAGETCNCETVEPTCNGCESLKCTLSPDAYEC